MNRKKLWCVLVLSIFLMGGPFPNQATAMVLGDFDHDSDVDSADFVHFRACALGAAIPQTFPACIDTRLDADQDVDMDDFGAFQRCYSGAGKPANPNCGCPSGQTDCNGTCTKTATDNLNCGACGKICPTGTACQTGVCTPIGPPPDDDCNNGPYGCQ